MNLIENIGKRFKMIRVDANYKQKELANKLNIQPALLSMYEQGKREPSITFIDRFCKAFDLSLSQFFIFPSNSNQKEPTEIIDTLQKILFSLEKEKLNSIGSS